MRYGQVILSPTVEARRQRRSDMILVATVIAAGLVITTAKCFEDDRPMTLANLSQRLPCQYLLNSRGHALSGVMCRMADSDDGVQFLLPWKLTDRTDVLSMTRRSQMHEGGRLGSAQDLWAGGRRLDTAEQERRGS